MRLRPTRALVAAVVLAACMWTGSSPTGAGASAHADQPPVFAYYYIWFQPSSWNRAKTDYPLLGRYSSDDETVMREHVEMAKAAGIDGFIVSWKSTPDLDARLASLRRIAAEEDFELMVIYQGLDFERRPLPVGTVAADMRGFERRYANDPAFDFFGAPVIIWSGTWEFSREEIATVTRSLDGVQVLASERNLPDYERVADLFDGNAYYWSSVNPDTFPGYEEKLADMGAAAHARGGLWIAPAAPGFDARLIGGTTVVERSEGETLRRQFDAAVSSSPDAVGLISWNEFSENSHIEPSVNRGTEALEVVADLRGAEPPELENLDSSAPGQRAGSNYRNLLALLALLGVIGFGFVAARRRA